MAAAKAWLSAKNPTTVAAIKSKQAARLVLAKQAELVKHMVSEGLLTTRHAEIFLEEISQDTQRIEQERNRMYNQLTRAKQGQDGDKEERGSFFSRFSIFSTRNVSRPSAPEIVRTITKDDGGEDIHSCKSSVVVG